MPIWTKLIPLLPSLPYIMKSPYPSPGTRRIEFVCPTQPAWSLWPTGAGSPYVHRPRCRITTSWSCTTSRSGVNGTQQSTRKTEINKEFGNIKNDVTLVWPLSPPLLCCTKRQFYIYWDKAIILHTPEIMQSIKCSPFLHNECTYRSRIHNSNQANSNWYEKALSAQVARNFS